MVARFLLLLCLGSSMLFAMDDTLPKGQIRFKTTFRVLEAEDYFNAEGTAVPFFLDQRSADYEDQIGEIEFQYGWEPRITLVAATSYRRRELGSDAGSLSNSGQPGVYLAMRQRLSPMGSASFFLTETGVWLPTDADGDEALPLESGGIDWNLTVGYGQYFYPTRGSFEMDMGYRFRNGDAEAEWFFDTRLSLDIRRVARARLSYHVVESTEDRLVEYAPTTYPSERGYQTLGLVFERQISRRWIGELGYEDRLDGRNLFKVSGYRLSLIWRG